MPKRKVPRRAASAKTAQKPATRATGKRAMTPRAKPVLFETAETLGKETLMTKTKAKPNARGAAGASKARTPATKSSSASKSALKAGAVGSPATQRVDARSRDRGDWRGETLARMRALILEADPEMIEERKWFKPTNPAGVPVWSHAGIVCTGETYAKVVKLTFARGASLPDPSRLFNSSLEGNTRRAIDIHEGETVDARAFKALVKAAVAVNVARAK